MNMVSNRSRRIFVSHPYNREKYHEKVVNLLSRNGKLPYFDHSIPQNEKMGGSKQKINKKIEQKIRTANDVIIIASNHASRRPYIKKEIQMARKYDKNIVAVLPRGQQKVSKVIRENATKIVGWNSNSIKSAFQKRKQR